MSTLADELLNDFEDSDSEGEGDQQNGFLQDGPSPPAANGHHTPAGSMVLDGDEEDVDSDDEMKGMQGDRAVADVEDEEEAKAKVEKMHLGGVNDVRSVAGLMKTLEPVLEVCTSLCTRSILLRGPVFTSFVDIALTFAVTFRKSPIIRICPPDNRLASLVLLKITQNTTSLHSRIRFRPPLTTKSSSYISTSATTTRLAFLSWRPWSRTLWTTRSP